MNKTQKILETAEVAENEKGRSSRKYECIKIIQTRKLYCISFVCLSVFIRHVCVIYAWLLYLNQAVWYYSEFVSSPESKSCQHQTRLGYVGHWATTYFTKDNYND